MGIRQILGRDLKFARRAVNGFKPCLYRAQALGIKLNAAQIIIQRIHRFLQLYARRL